LCILRFPGCDIDCLRSKPIEDILNAQQDIQKIFNLLYPLESFLPWTPTVDGVEIPMQSIEAFANGKYQKMPMMIGSVSEEAHMFIYLAISSNISDIEYIGAIFALFQDEAGEVLELYPPFPIDGDKRTLMGVVGTDYIFTAPTRNVTQNFVKHSEKLSQDIYLYQFDHVLSFDAWGPNYTFCNGHVCHGAELPFVFHTAELAGYKFTPEEELLSQSMVFYWTNFARTGNPNVGQNQVPVEWTSFSIDSLDNLEFSTPISLNYQLRKKYCDFFDSIGYNWGW